MLTGIAERLKEEYAQDVMPGTARIVVGPVVGGGPPVSDNVA